MDLAHEATPSPTHKGNAMLSAKALELTNQIKLAIQMEKGDSNQLTIITDSHQETDDDSAKTITDEDDVEAQQFLDSIRNNTELQLTQTARCVTFQKDGEISNTSILSAIPLSQQTHKIDIFKFDEFLTGTTNNMLSSSNIYLMVHVKKDYYNEIIRLNTEFFRQNKIEYYYSERMADFYIKIGHSLYVNGNFYKWFSYCKYKFYTVFETNLKNIGYTHAFGTLLYDEDEQAYKIISNFDAHTHQLFAKSVLKYLNLSSVKTIMRSETDECKITNNIRRNKLIREERIREERDREQNKRIKLNEDRIRVEQKVVPPTTTVLQNVTRKSNYNVETDLQFEIIFENGEMQISGCGLEHHDWLAKLAMDYLETMK